MKKKKTLRQMLTSFSIWIVMLPLGFFAMASQIQLWYISTQTLRLQMESDLEKINVALDMKLDKYEAILYSFCTDDDIISLVDEIDHALDASRRSQLRRQMRRQLMHVCNRNGGVEGITLITQKDEVYFYDRFMASSVTSSWSENMEIFHDIGARAHYHGGREPIETENGLTNLIQINRRLVDYQDIDRDLGVVILSINIEELSPIVMLPEGSSVYICDGDRVVVASDNAMIGKDISQLKQRNMKILSQKNETSGWTIYQCRSLASFWKAMLYQSILWLIISGIAVMGLIGLIWRNTRPILESVNRLVLSMNEVEKKGFSVLVPENPEAGDEINRIVAGFNQMVTRLDEMMRQVKQSAIEQKNAELSAMEAQIDPHFLYNTLDTINWKALEAEQYEISGMVGDLADILRYSIRNPGEMVSVGQEMSWLRQYIRLQSSRLDRRLQVIVDVPRELEGRRIHKLLLQPFVENAIKHGFAGAGEECKIKISIRAARQQLHIVIKDNGAGISRETLRRLNRQDIEKSHVGIANVQKRLKLYYGEEAAIYFESKENEYTKVHLLVPMC